MHVAIGPTRAQKRWSGRLRTGGALLALLGGVALADRLLGLASKAPELAATGQWKPPLAAGLVLLAIGGALFGLGRRWR